MSGASIWVNGERRSSDLVHVSARDRGFTLADGVFETMRVIDGTIFRLDRHLARLSRSLSALAIAEPPLLREWVRSAVEPGSDGSASVRLTVTRGPAAGGLLPSMDASPTVVVTVGPMPAFPDDLHDVGLTAIVASGRFNERAMTVGHKTLAYTDAVMAILEARRADADEAIFLDTEAHCAEASASNLFALSNGTLMTPPLTCGVLPGITRASVIELAVAAGLPVAEHAFGLESLMGADEVFLTSSLRGLAPVVRVDGRAIGNGRPGPHTRTLAGTYAALVTSETSQMTGRS